MIFRELKLKNFGIYHGLHEIDFDSKNLNRNAKPIVLIGALNGSGKTTILDAIQLAIYGNSASQSNRTNGSYQAYLESLVNNKVKPKEDTEIELTIQIQREQKIEVITLRRFWRKNKKGISESFEVRVNGDMDSFATSNWDDVVEEIIPRGIAHLFFFDGEKIEKLASPDEAAKIIKTGLHSLLGLDLVDRLKSDLEIIERKRKKDILTKEEKDNLNKIESEIKEQQILTDKTFQKLGEVTNKIDRLEKEKCDLEIGYKKIGGELYDARLEIKENKEIYENQLIELKRCSNDFVSKTAPLILVHELLEQAEKQSNEELSVQSFKILTSEVEKRDMKLISHLKENQLDVDTIKNIESYLREDRKQNTKKIKNITFLNVDSVIFSKLPDEVFSVIKKETKEIIEKSSEILEKIHHADKQLNAVPEKEQVAELLSALNANQTKIEKLTIKKEKIEKDYNINREILNRKRSELEKAYELNIEKEINQEKAERILSHIKNVKNTLVIFRREVADKHIHMLERLILDSFVQLIRKSNFVSSIRIQPVTFNLRLFDDNNGEIESNKLSAGERQLLSIAILWGLAKASGRPLPTIIDTPLGRLDTKHRENLVKHYFPDASHQVILLSTDTEINQEYYRKLKPKINKTFKIDFNEKLQSSVITQGYF